VGGHADSHVGWARPATPPPSEQERGRVVAPGNHPVDVQAGRQPRVSATPPPCEQAGGRIGPPRRRCPTPTRCRSPFVPRVSSASPPPTVMVVFLSYQFNISHLPAQQISTGHHLAEQG